MYGLVLVYRMRIFFAGRDRYGGSAYIRGFQNSSNANYLPLARVVSHTLAPGLKIGTVRYMLVTEVLYNESLDYCVRQTSTSHDLNPHLRGHIYFTIRSLHAVKLSIAVAPA